MQTSFQWKIFIFAFLSCVLSLIQHLIWPTCVPYSAELGLGCSSGEEMEESGRNPACPWTGSHFLFFLSTFYCSLFCFIFLNSSFFFGCLKKFRSIDVGASHGQSFMKDDKEYIKNQIKQWHTRRHLCKDNSVWLKSVEDLLLVILGFELRSLTLSQQVLYQDYFSSPENFK